MPSAFPSDFAAVPTEDDAYPIAAFHRENEMLVPMVGDVGGSMTLKGIIWTGPDGESMTLFVDEEDRPIKVVIEGVVFLFDNHTSTTVDVAVIKSEGPVGTLRNLPLALDSLAAKPPEQLAKGSQLDFHEELLERGWFALRNAACAITTGCAGISSCTEAVSTAGRVCESDFAKIVPELLAKLAFPEAGQAVLNSQPQKRSRALKLNCGARRFARVL